MPFPPPNPPYHGPARFHGATNNKPIRRIVLHGTVSATVAGGAVATADYFRYRVTRPSSAHYVVDPVNTVQVVPDSVVAYHAPPNENSIGVELCDWVAANNGRGPGPAPVSRWSDGPHSSMLKNAAELVAQLCLAYDVPIRMVGPVGLRLGRHGICEHSDVSAAWHQSSHWDVGAFPRRRFLRMVKREAARMRDAQNPKKPRRDTRVARFARKCERLIGRYLDPAIKDGRSGTVRSVRDNIRDELRRLN